MGWLPEPAIFWIVPALIASLFGFANAAAKDEAGGFFLGFPSYWNVVAFYLGLLHAVVGAWPNAAIVLLLAVLTLLPVRFAYPNLVPKPWRLVLTLGGVAWLAIAIVMLIDYPTPAPWLIAVSMIYPVLYVGVSMLLSRMGE
jgi:phosphatidylcholine synthase